jgi:hypothetical protein
MVGSWYIIAKGGTSMLQPLPLINDALVMNIRPFQIKVIIIFGDSF